MELTVEVRAGGIGLLRPTGRLDLLWSTELRQRFAQVVAEGTPRLVVDLGEVSFVDSSGLAALISGLKAARLAGGDLRIARANDQVRSVLTITSLDRVLRPYATVDEATAGY